MTGYNLKPHQLVIDKKYITERGTEAHINENKVIVNSDTENGLNIGPCTRFKEIKKESEFEIIKLYKHLHGEIRFSEANINGMWKEQEYKIKDGKLFMKDKNE